MIAVFGFAENERKTVLPPFPCAVLVLSVILSAAYLGSGLSLPLAIISASFSLIIGIAFTRSLLGTLMTVLPALAVWMYTDSVTLAALASAAVTVLGVTAFVYKVTRSPWILAVPPLSYLLAYAASGSLKTALFSLVLFPTAAVMCLCISGKRSRNSLICRASVSLFITLVAIVLIALAVKGGGLSTDAMRSASDSLFSSLKNHFTEQYAALSQQYTSTGISAVDIGLTSSDAATYALTVFFALPAIFITLFNIVSFAASQLTISLFARGGLHEYLTPISLSFSMSWVSAAVFFMSVLTRYTVYGKYADTVTLIAENIYLILLPGLAFTGILTLLGRGPGRKKHIFSLIAVAALFLYSPSSALAASAFVGCFTVTSVAIITAISKNTSK